MDNLRRAAAILAARERPGDAILYLPSGRRILSAAYPAPYSRLRDIALRRSPVAAGNLAGTEVGSATLRRRAAGARRIWLITLASGRRLPAGGTRTDREKVALVRQMRLAGLWHAGAVRLRLYVRP